MDTQDCSNHKKEVAELWRDVIGFEGLYRVSDFGNVLSCSRKFKPNGGRMKPKKTKLGYLEVCLTKNRKKYYPLVHSLVAKAFIPNPAKLSQVNHKNGNKYNNKAINLEWVTSSQNIKHAFDNGLMIQPKGGDAYNAKLTESQARYILNSNERTTLLARKYSVAASTITSIRKRITWKHLN